MQSILLFVANLVVIIPIYVIATVLVLMNTTITSLLAMLLWLVAVVVGIAIFVFFIISAIKAYGGEVYKVPVIGNFADKFSN